MSGGSVLPPQNYNRRSDREGDWCPALFFSKPISGERYWPGLIPIRVLQIVGNLYRNSKAIRRYPAAWIPILHSLFGYSTEQINEALLRLLDYGLIEKGSLAWNNEGKANVVLRLTAKGEFILNLPFNDLVVHAKAPQKWPRSVCIELRNRSPIAHRKHTISM